MTQYSEITEPRIPPPPFEVGEPSARIIQEGHRDGPEQINDRQAISVAFGGLEGRELEHPADRSTPGGLDNVSDVDNAVTGIAIVHNNQQHGDLYYSLNGGNDSLDQAVTCEVNYQSVLMSTEDHGEAAQAFMAKRKPNFTGN